MDNMNSDSKSIGGSFLYWVFASIFLAASIGWASNVVKLVRMLWKLESLDMHVSAMLLARIVGLFVAPFGGVMGYL